MQRGTSKRSIHLQLIAALLCVAASIASAQQTLSITYLDVGQGDAALIRAPNNKTVLIDAGPSPTRVADWLRAAGIDTVDLAIASHNHADHIGGMPAVLSTVHVRNYMDNGMVATTRIYMRVITLLEERGIPVLRAARRRIDLGEGVIIRIFAGTPEARTQNDGSIGVELIYGTFRAFFTGDAESRQRAFWATDSLWHVSVLKVSHHGSINGTDAKLLHSLRPCVAVISVGARNSFGHPSPAVLRLLESSGITTYRTDRVGKVSINADSSGAFTVDTPGPAKSSSSFTPACNVR